MADLKAFVRAAPGIFSTAFPAGQRTLPRFHRTESINRWKAARPSGVHL